MAEKERKPCKRRKCDTLEAALSTGLHLLDGESIQRQSDKGTKQAKPVHFHLVKSGYKRKMHTPYRSRVKPNKDCSDDVTQSCSSIEHACTSFDIDEDSGQQIDEDLDAELESMIAECTELLDSQPKKQRVNKTWSHRMADLHSSWTENRSKIFHTLVSMEYLPDGSLCTVCLTNPAKIRCCQCGTYQVYCQECDRSCHSNKPFHDREVWFENHFESIGQTQSVDENGQLCEIECYIPFSKITKCLHCGCYNSFEAISSKEPATVFTVQGRFDINSSSFVCKNCSCSSPLAIDDVLRNRYWPASPTNLATLFAHDLFLTWGTLQKRMPGCSEASFLKSLEDVSLMKGRIGTINPRIFTKAYREWKYCMFELDLLQSKNWLNCPCCYFHQHSCHVDGNMKLYRYKQSGIRKDESYYGDIFVASNADVGNHIEEIYKHPNLKNFVDDGKCGETNWRAAGNKLKRYTRLDETGLEIAGCRHALAQWAVNMFRGEIYGYANFIRIQKMIPHNVEYMWEDIICKYWKWAANTPNNKMAEGNIKPALSVMHAKAHNWSCQIQWGGRWQDGAACSTGEEVEQINSYLSRISNTTKYMLPESREELITEHAIAWNRRKILSLTAALSKRYAKTLKGLESATKDLDDALSAVKLARGSVDVMKWKNDVFAQIVARELDSRSISKVSEKEEFFLLSCETLLADLLPNITADQTAERCYLDKHLKKSIGKYETREDQQRRREALASKLCVESSTDEVIKDGRKLCIRRTLDTVRNELELLSFSVYQRKICVDKVAASSKVRAKLRKKISSDHALITPRIKVHNELQLLLGEESLQPLSQSAVADGMFPWTVDDISVRLKCKIVDKFQILTRHEEEVDLIKKEMTQYLRFYKDVITHLTSEVKDLKAHLAQEISTSFEANRIISEETKKSKYAISGFMDQTVILGEMSLKWKGIQFAKQQLDVGLQRFAHIKAGEFDEYVEEESDVESLSEDDSTYDVDDDY